MGLWWWYSPRLVALQGQSRAGRKEEGRMGRAAVRDQHSASPKPDALGTYQTPTRGWCATHACSSQAARQPATNPAGTHLPLYVTMMLLVSTVAYCSTCSSTDNQQRQAGQAGRAASKQASIHTLMSRWLQACGKLPKQESS